MIFRLKENTLDFPPPELAEEDGLLAIGGDLSVKRLLMAYRMGIFPWFSEETPILWYSPHERFVLFPERFKISKSLRQVIKSGRFNITKNKAFNAVITACAAISRPGQNGTWITDEMKQSYIQLYEAGYAHSIEVWNGKKLSGGLYGVAVNQVFCGESMFSLESNASKCALAWLCSNGGYRLIDCQIFSEHLESMGAELISRKNYMELLDSINLDR